jgi:hypothetical protein
MEGARANSLRSWLILNVRQKKTFKMSAPSSNARWLAAVFLILGLVYLAAGFRQKESGMAGDYRHTGQPVYWYQSAAVGCLLIVGSIWMMVPSKTKK